MELSKRLQAVADLVTDCEEKTVADVGCDHGYIPIYLIEDKRVRKAIAMDVNQGPLDKAKEHIEEHQMTTYIETRLSDGLTAIQLGEVSTVIIAGMGGGLVMKILEQDRRLWDSLDSLILQPQSELCKVRQYLEEQHFQLLAEDMVLEDGKFYPMMKVAYDPAAQQMAMVGHKLTPEELEYGPILLQEKHPVLRQYLEREIQIKEEVLSNLEGKTGQHIEDRQMEIEQDIRRAKDALQRYYS